MLIRIEKSDCLVTVMTRVVCKRNSTYLDHENEMIGPRISVCERKCEVKCLPGGPDLFVCAQGNAFGNIAHQRRLNAERLCRSEVSLLQKS
jgi:hypothetical protein